MPCVESGSLPQWMIELGVSQRVLEQVVVLGVAEPPPEAVGVRRAPVPAFPAVGVVQDVGEPDEVEEPGPGRGPVPEVAPVVVRGGSGRDRLRPVVGADALHLAGDEVQRLVPADPLVAGLAPVLRVPLPVGVEVHPLHRVEDPLVRVDARAFGQREGSDAGLARRSVLLPVYLQRPGGRVVVVEHERPHADDLAVLDVHPDRAAAGAVHEALFRHLAPLIEWTVPLAVLLRAMPSAPR